MLLAVDDDGEPSPRPLVRAPSTTPAFSLVRLLLLADDEGATASDADWSGDVRLGWGWDAAASYIS
jgi:hypothetical protein